jgi:hypothetical protein
LLYTPHLNDPNPNQLYFLLQPSENALEESPEYKAKHGKSCFDVEWPIIQRAINLASPEHVKTDLDGAEQADQLKRFLLRSLKTDSFKGYIPDPDTGEEKETDAETLLRDAIKLSAQGKMLSAIPYYREASALLSIYGRNYGAAMVRELALQTNLAATPAHAIDKSWRQQISDDHLAAAHLWESTLNEDLSSNSLRRAYKNALMAEEYGYESTYLCIVEDILLASATWARQQGDTTKETESVLHAVLRQIYPLMYGRDLDSDEWKSLASLLDYISIRIPQSNYAQYLERVEEFADLAHHNATGLLQRAVKSTMPPAFTVGQTASPVKFAN